MRGGAVSVRVGAGLLLALGAVACIVSGGMSCGTAPSSLFAPTPFLVSGPGQIGNEPPTLTLLEPTANITVGQGDPFLIRWTDTDRDDNATISFSLVHTETNERVLLVTGIAENDTVGQDAFTVSTTLIPPGTYNLRGTIDDQVNPPVDQFAELADVAVRQRVIITIVGPGEGPQTVPPTVTVTEPGFNLSVAQEDLLTVAVQPTAQPPDPANPIPFDPDSNIRLFIVLDLDQDPNNDDPANPSQTCVGGDRNGEECSDAGDCGNGECRADIIVLRDVVVQEGSFEAIVFEITVDLAVIPPRPAGEPYFIRASVDDGTNPRVHSYAVGTISVVRLAAGRVDLFDIGRTKSGARFQGFNPKANLGSAIASVSDFDADGVADFVLVAQFGNPQNFGPVGEAYLIYGQDRVRFGGTIPINSVSDTVSGAIFQAPPIRPLAIGGICGSVVILPESAARTDGITDAGVVRDLTGDGRPEILLGLPHVSGAFDAMDYDPGDDEARDFDPCGCYPDFLVNNYTGGGDDVEFYFGGMAIMINSQNRDNDPLIADPRPSRLDTTAIALELVGQPRWILDPGGVSANGSGSIYARADNQGLAGDDLGSDPEEPGRIAGARFIAGGYDFLDPFGLQQPPREGLFGQSVASIGDLNSDGLDEIIISSPRNERYLADLEAEFGFSTHFWSTTFPGSIAVLPGRNYNLELERNIADDSGTARSPFLDQQRHAIQGRCTTPVEPRHYDIAADSFDIFAEDIDDMLGGAGSAGDFNRDGLGDILCGAPLNDRSNALPDTGAAYVIYGRTTFGGVLLENADDPVMRTPMLRVRGLTTGDQIGWRQMAGLDVNGDRVDDVFISSPRTDFGDVTRPSCPGGDLGLLTFNNCRDEVGDQVFSDDACKMFDYDNDEDIDDDDECVFCCLSGDCQPDDTCLFGQGDDCCEGLVDNGFVGIIFGGVFINGDRDIDQLASSELPGTIFFGGKAGDRAGMDVSSAGDFNQDGFGDILITAPGRTETDGAGRERLGVVYLIFGGTHLINTTWNLEDVGSEELPGIVFLSPYVKGRPNEAAPTTVAFIGDINNDGFGDIAVGNPKADFIDPSFPQGPDAPGNDPATGRRSNVGDVYVIYGNNFGTNRSLP